MDDSNTRLADAITAFDEANRQDPHQEPGPQSSEPRALLYARRMSQWLGRIEPDASEALQLAARSQHIRRWTRPRTDYPATRAGYHRWRTALYQFHADTAGEILSRLGFESATIQRVGSLLRKENLKTDREAQTLEDVICLVFLENYFADFALQHEDEKVIAILRKTWKKMSPRGQAEALKLPLSDRAGLLVKRALATP